MARTLHASSPRRSGPFVSLNCAAVPSELIESELFGHEKGAFTGAAGRQLGKFEHAHRGIFFLDEIGDMPLVMQAKLLRVLEEGEIEPIGCVRPIPVDVRVIAATHQDLGELVQQGRFRQDLYHRIYVFPLHLPPLRQRLEDIPVLVDYFVKQVSAQNGWKPKRFLAEAITELQQYLWPGNVRELRNVVERLLLLSETEVDGSAVRSTLPVPSQSPLSLIPPGGTLADKVKALEREVVLTELEKHAYRMAETARVLGLERSHLYKKCQQLGIDLQIGKRDDATLE